MPTRKKTTTAKKVSSPKKSSVAKRTVRQTVSSVSNTKTGTVYAAPASSYLKNPRLWVGAAVVFIAVLLYFYRGLFVAATVNGQPISRLSVVSQLEKQNGKQALSNLIVESLIMQEAQKKHITVSQSELDAEMKKIQDQLKTQGVTLADALASRGLTQSDLVDQIKLQKTLDKMVGSSVKVTDDDVQAYIDKNQDTLPKDMPDADLRKQVRKQLEQQQLQDKIQSFVSDLQKKAKITYFVNY